MPAGAIAEAAVVVVETVEAATVEVAGAAMAAETVVQAIAALAQAATAQESVPAEHLTAPSAYALLIMRQGTQNKDAAQTTAPAMNTKVEGPTMVSVTSAKVEVRMTELGSNLGVIFHLRTRLLWGFSLGELRNQKAPAPTTVSFLE